MFEELERARQRRGNAVDPALLRPREVRSLQDIQQVLAEFDPARPQDGPEVTLSTTLEGEDDAGAKQQYVVSAVTRSKSKRSLLLEGFEVLKRRHEVLARAAAEATPVEINGRAMAPPLPPTEDPRVYVDPMIGQWMGAQRRGMLICWDLPDGHTYKYDIYSHRLTRSKT